MMKRKLKKGNVKPKKGYRRVYAEGTAETEFGRRKEVDVYRPGRKVSKTLVKDITYKTEDSPRIKWTEREVTRKNKDGTIKSYKKIRRKNGKLFEEASTKKIKYEHGGPHDPPEVKQRRGVRENPDGTVSSHLMRAEYIPERGWVGFPSLFQDSKPYADDQQNWVDMSEEEDWMKVYEEAERRGEVYEFGEDKEAALAFGEGSWKDQLPDEYIEAELTDEEADKYRAGGYVLEEMATGGPGDKLKKFARNLRNTTFGFEPYSKLNPASETWGPRVKFSTVVPKRQTQWTLSGDIGSSFDKDAGLSASVNAINYGKFLDGQRRLNSQTQLSGFYDDGVYGIDLAAGPNLHWGKKWDQPLKGGQGRFDLQPFNLRLGTSFGHEKNAGVGDTFDTKGGKLNWGYGAGAKFQYKPKWKKFRPTFFADANYNMDLVEGDNSGSLGATVGSGALERHDIKFQPEHKFNIRAGLTLPLDNLSWRRDKTKKIKDRKLYVKEEETDYEKIVKEQEKAEENKESARHPRWLEDGGYVLEEMHEGGDVPHPAHHMTMQERRQAYDDSTTLYNYSQNLIKLKDRLEAWPTYGEAYGEGLNTDSFEEGEYDRYLTKTAPGKDSRFVNFIDSYFTGNTPEVNAFLRLRDLNQDIPGYTANTINIPSGYDQYKSRYFTTYEKPKVPIRKPTMKEAYENVDKDKYPTFEDFEFAAEFYKEHGENPDPSDFPSNRLPPPPEPEYEVEDIEPEIEIEKLPMMPTGSLETDHLPDELEQGEEDIQYRMFPKRHVTKTKEGKYTKKGKLKRNIFGKRKTKTHRNVDWIYDEKKKKDELEYPGDFVPRFFKDGGFMELDLSPEEVTMYANGGYILEEVPQFEPGGANDPGNPLSDWANQQALLWENLYETDARGRDLAGSYFANIGDNYNLGILNKGKNVPHWSAATVSNAVMANIGASDRETAQILGFNPTASHSGYVRDAFKASQNPEYKYNRYVAEKIGDSEYGIGDIVVHGRSGTKNWKFKDFERARDSYESHGDIIVDKGVDKKGEYVILAGGNLSNTYKNRKVYTKTLANSYTVKLTDTKKGERLMGASSKSSNNVGASMQKATNIGEDVTINKKTSSPFYNNFDWNDDNDQIFEEPVTAKAMPPTSKYTGSLVGNQQQALFGDDTLGIGYLPYQYQFPDYLGTPSEEELEEVYIPDFENIALEDKVDEPVEDETTAEDDPVEDETSDLADEADEALTEYAEQVQQHIGPLSNVPVDNIKELLSAENRRDITMDSPIIQLEGKTLSKADKEYKANIDKGLVWISWTDQNPQVVTPEWNASRNKKNSRFQPPKLNIFGTLGEVLKDDVDEDGISIGETYRKFGEMYGDGSLKYGQWVTKAQIEKFQNEKAAINSRMQNSGRAEGFHPEFHYLYGPTWGTFGTILGLRNNSNLNTGDYEPRVKHKKKGFIESLPQIWDNITDWPIFNQYGGSIPKAKDGGYVLDLDEEEVEQYVQNGYIVEEIK